MSEQPRRRRRQQIIVEEIQELHDVKDDGVIEQSFDEQEERKGTSENIQKNERKVQKKHTHVRQTQKLLLVSIIAVLIVVISVLAFSTLNTSNPVKKYSAAQELMAKGKYDKAADKFESLGSYEDATTLTMYCKACALCESGNYEAGVAAFKTLGDFKDSTYRITYYTARACEDVAGSDYWEYMSQAQSMYNTIPVFLDSAERISALNKRIEKAKTNQYDAAVKAGENGDYTAALNGFDRLGNYMDSKERFAYYQIRRSEDSLGDSPNQDSAIAIADKYTNMGRYLDCTDRAAALLAKADAIVADRYAKVAALIAEGKYSDAEVILALFGTYGNERIPENYYIIAENYLAESNWDNAFAAFQKAGNYSDAVERINEVYYRKAEALLADGKWDEATATFKKAGMYNDAEERIGEPYYKKGEALRTESKWEEAIEAYKVADMYTYKDAKNRSNYCQYRRYEERLFGSDDQDSIIRCASNYQTINTCLDSAERAQQLITLADSIVAGRYTKVANLIDEEKYGDAEDILASFGTYGNEKVTENYYAIAEKYLAKSMWEKASTAFIKAGTYGDAAERINEPYYKQAEVLLSEGEYVKAWDAFAELKNFRDSKERTQSIYDMYGDEILKTASVGDEVLFGAYEQDNDLSNGKETIKWLVLAKEDNRLLVISLYGLDCQPYNATETGVTWETCTLRKWLNDDFLNMAFSNKEQAQIPIGNVLSYEKRGFTNTFDKKYTQDKVFLLSSNEVREYFEEGKVMKCVPTAYAKRQGVYVSTDSGNCSWWLRTPGRTAKYASRVSILSFNSDSWGIDKDGGMVTLDNEAVCPALWIDLES